MKNSVAHPILQHIGPDNWAMPQGGGGVTGKGKLESLLCFVL